MRGFTFATVVESALPVGVAAMTAAVLLLAAGILALPTALVVLPWPRDWSEADVVTGPGWCRDPVTG